MGQKEATNKTMESMMLEFEKGWASWSVKYAPHLVQAYTKEFYKQQQPNEKNNWSKKCDGWAKAGQIDQATADFFKQVPEQEPIVAMILKALMPITLFFKWLRSNNDIASLDMQYKALAKATPNPAPVDNLVRSMMIDPNRANENRAELKKYGFNDTQIDNIVLSYYRLYEENTVRVCYLRGIIDETKMYERMRELGYTDTRTKEIVQTWELLPPPQDLFTMVAKEAFEPDIYKKLGLDAEFPTEQVEWLKKQGISEDWARKYWIAHWAQPSIGQGFEMLHRGVIDLDTLDLLFRATEIPSFWRDKLTKIAYQPYTRVDVRRMHNLGTIGDEELIKAYLDLGYDAEHALNMANFTIKYNAETQQQLTRSTILNTYREGLVSRKDAVQMLKNLDYDEGLANFYLTLEDYEKEKELQKLKIENIRDQFLLNLMNEQEARSLLNQLGLLGEKTDLLIEEWNIQIYKYQRLPSKSDLDVWLIKGVIQENEYIDTMKNLGYTWRHIQLYLTEMIGERDQEGRAPTKSDLDRWVKKKYINELEYRKELGNMGYSNKYIKMYLKDQGYG